MDKITANRRKDKNPYKHIRQKTKNDWFMYWLCEDTEFNNQFCVFSSNQVEARYLLTPAFMERLLSLEKLCGGGVSCCFYDEKIVIQLRHTDTNKWFDSPSIDRKVDFIPECNMIITQMNEIFRIIDILKLNQKSVI